MTIILILSALVLILIFVRKYLLVTKGIRIEKVILSKAGNPAKLLKSFHKKGESKQPEHTHDPQTQIKILYTQAVMHYENGDLEEASEHLIKVLQIDDTHTDSNLKLGLIFLKKGLFDKAESVFKKLITQTDNDPVLHSNLGRALYEQKKFDEALDAYLKSISLDKTRAARYLSTAEVYKALSEPLKAEEMYKKACDLAPENADFLLTFAHFEMELGKATQAKYYVRQALKADPDNQLAKEMLTEIG